MCSLRLSQELKPKFKALEKEEGLIDDCKYMLYFAEGWGVPVFPNEPPYTCVAVHSKAEAIDWLKRAVEFRKGQ